MRLRLIKSRLSKVLCLALGSVAVTAPIIACSNSLSQELYISISGQQFFNEIISNEFIKHYVSDKGNPINYSKENSTDHDMCKKINDLIKPKDMIFLMGYDVAHMFKDDEEKIVEYCRNVVLYVDKFNNQFNVSECWTDKNYAFPAPYSGVTGANCVAHCINDTRIAVSQVGIDTQLGVWKVVFSPVTPDPKLSIDRFATDESGAFTTTIDTQKILTWTLSLAAKEILFPGWEFPIIVS